MKVLLVSEFALPVGGGREVQVDLQAGVLAAAGHEVHLATLTPDATPSHPAVQVHVIGRSVTAHLPHPAGDRPYHPPVPDPLVTAALRRLIAEVRPDVVHAHSWMVASLPRRLPCPLVLTVHDVSITCPKHTLLRDDSTDCSGPGVATCAGCMRRSGYGAAAAVGLAVTMPLGRRLLRPDAVICITRYVRSALTGIDAPVDVVLPGCVPDDFACHLPEVPALPPAPYVLFAGDPGWHKGSDLLLDIWVGPTPPAANLVLALTRPPERPVPTGVTVCRLTHAEVAAAMAGAAVVVVPSRWREPLGMVAVEAMAVGTPVVASDAGGLPEVVTHGREGLLFAPGDAGALRRHITRLLADGTLRAEMGERARVRSLDYRASAFGPKLLDVYAAATSAWAARGRRD